MADKGKLFSTYDLDEGVQPRIGAEAREALRRKFAIDFTDEDFREIEEALAATLGALRALKSAPKMADLARYWTRMGKMATDLHSLLTPDEEPGCLHPPANVEAARRVQHGARINDADSRVSDDIDEMVKRGARPARIYEFDVFLRVLSSLPFMIDRAKKQASAFTTTDRGTRHYQTLVSHLEGVCRRRGLPTRFTSVEDCPRASFIADLAEAVAEFLPAEARPRATAIVARMAKGKIPGKPRIGKRRK